MKFSIPPQWGIKLIAAWSFVLAFVAFASLLLLTQSVELYSNQYGNQTQVWIIFGLKTCFGLTFMAGGYGLWQFENWGRVAFLWTITVWAGFNLFSLFVSSLDFSNSGSYSTSTLTFNSLRFVVALVLPLLYLNLPHVKNMFQLHAPDSH